MLKYTNLGHANDRVPRNPAQYDEDNATFDQLTRALFPEHDPLRKRGAELANNTEAIIVLSPHPSEDN